MPIRLRAFAMLLAILWQSLAMLSPMSVAAKAMEYEHAALHAQTSGHHHHDDGSLHVEAVDSTSHHLHADSGLHSAGLPPGAINQALPAHATSPVGVPLATIPTPYLEGPLRPPRITA